jgi:hypothetical protein
MTRCQNRFQEVIKRRLTRQRNVKRIMTLQRLISRFHHHPNLIKIRSLLKPFILTRWMVVVITPNEQFSSYIKARTSYTRWDDYDVRFVLDQLKPSVANFIVLGHWNDSLQVVMSLHLDTCTLSWLRVNQSLFLLLIMLSA